MTLTTRVFVSATSRDLASYRERARKALNTGDVHTVTQEHFGPDHRSLLENLQARIVSCDAVICLVGFTFGSAPPETPTPARSYAQIEHDLARSLGKPVYVFLATEDCPPDNPPVEEERERALQLRHRAAVQKSSTCTPFRSREELELRITQLIPLLPRRSDREPLPPLLLHPPETPAFFSGRDSELRQLAKALASRLPCVVVVLGMGGQGKTTLVAHWVRSREPLPFDGLFWCTAYRGGFTFDAFLDAALDYLERGEFDKRSCPEQAARVERLLQRLQERRTLLVVDGAERWLRGWAGDATDSLPAEAREHREGLAQALDDFLRQATGLAHGSHVLLTSRALPAALDHAEYATVPLDDEGRAATLEGLSDADAAALLRSFGIAGEEEELNAITRAYANHPLALTVLATLWERGHRNRLPAVGEISALDPRQRLFQLLDEMSQHLPERRRAERFLQVASLCLEHPTLTTLSAVLGETDRSWRARLARWSERVLQAPVQSAWSPDTLRLLAVTLARWHLIGWSDTEGAVRLHATVKEFFAERTHDAQRVHRALAAWYAGQMPTGEPSSLAEVRPRVLAIDHALAGAEADRAAALLFSPYTPSYTFAEWLSAWGHHAEGITLMGRVADAAEEPTKALCLLGRASLLLETRRAAEAQADLMESVRLLEARPRTGSADRRNLARALMTRGSTLREIAQTSKGLADFERAVRILEEDSTAHPELHLDLARALVQRAHAAWELGRWSAALQDYDQAEQVAAGPPDSEPTVLAVFLAGLRANRGVVRADLEDHSGAILDFEAAIACYGPLVDGGRRDLVPRLGHARIMLGTEWTSAGRTDAAIPLLERTLADLTVVVQAGRLDAEALQVLARRALAAAWVAAGRPALALPLADETVAAYRRIVDAGAPQYAGLLASSLLMRAAARFAAGDGDGSRADREQAFDIVRRLDDEWRAESDARVVVLRKQLEALRYLLPVQRQDAEHVLAESLAGIGDALRDRNASEGLRIEAQRALAGLLELSPAFAEAGIATDSLLALQRSL